MGYKSSSSAGCIPLFSSTLLVGFSKTCTSMLMCFSFVAFSKNYKGTRNETWLSPLGFPDHLYMLFMRWLSASFSSTFAVKLFQTPKEMDYGLLPPLFLQKQAREVPMRSACLRCAIRGVHKRPFPTGSVLLSSSTLFVSFLQDTGGR